MKAWIAVGVVLASTAWADHFDPFASMHGQPPKAATYETPGPDDIARFAPAPLAPAVARPIEVMGS